MENGGLLLRDLLPRFDVESAHSIQIDAPPSVVYRKVRELDMSTSRLMRTLFRLRGMPASALTAEGLSRIRFKPLRDIPSQAFVLGIIGRFWTMSGHLVDFAPDQFQGFDRPGYAKAIWFFGLAQTSSGGTCLETVTRVHCLDQESRRRFQRYWFFVGPFSRLIRKEVLKSVRDASEACVPEAST